MVTAEGGGELGGVDGIVPSSEALSAITGISEILDQIMKQQMAAQAGGRPFTQVEVEAMVRAALAERLGTPP